ncbi:MAG: NAD(P)-dependent oxidoreductase [Candidatus Hydrogenedentes bacterium]|nr:NAD(P)-dependent oxidoreductase [Candidatus Hydrogenedentota bacterium]
MASIAELEDRLSEPSPALIEMMRRLDGDILILGAGGKMGPSLAHLAARAVADSGVSRKVVAVSSFSSPQTRVQLDAWGIETIAADLLAPGALDTLPDAENVLYMCGRKFGSTGAEWNTWATNVYLAGLAGRRFAKSRIVSFSTGNIYPFEPLDSRGSTEATPPGPVGEYAMSCLGRERMFDYASHELGAKVVHYRLNYAAELRYGVMLDVAARVWEGQPVDIGNAAVNLVWQGYANRVALQCLELADSPPRILNVTGPEKVSVRWLARELGARLGRTPNFVGEESQTALISDASECHRLFGLPEVNLETLMDWVAHWVKAGGHTLGKPTHFETRDGKF